MADLVGSQLVGGQGGLAIVTVSLPDGQTGVLYSQTIQADGGTAPYTWSVVAGSLPSGLALNTSTGIVSGTPNTSATFTFTVRVADSASNTADLQYVMAVLGGPSLVITTASPLPNGARTSAYITTINGSGGLAPYSWAVTAGALPPGLTLNPTTGVISGTATSAGTYTFIISLTDSA